VLRLGKRLSLNPSYRPLHTAGFRLKVPRPVHREGDPAAQEAYKNLCQRVEEARAEGRAVRAFAHDAHRLGLKPLLRKVWAREAVVARRYQWFYVCMWSRRAGPA